MAGFTLSGGFHFDSTGNGGVAPAGIKARGIGGMTFTPPPPPPPSFEAYTYQPIQLVQDWHNDGGDKTTTYTYDLAGIWGAGVFQPDDIMLMGVWSWGVDGTNSANFCPTPAGWTQILTAPIKLRRLEDYGIGFNVYWKAITNGARQSDGGDAVIQIDPCTDGGGVRYLNRRFSLLVLRNTRVTGGPITSPIGWSGKQTSYALAGVNYPDTDLHQFNNTSTVDDNTSTVVWFGGMEFGHRDIYANNYNNLLNSGKGNGSISRVTAMRTLANEDYPQYSGPVIYPEVYQGGSARYPATFGVGVEIMARPTHTGGPWPSSLEQPE